MKKCYIAGKIGGLSELEYKTNFEVAKREVEALGYEAISPVDLPHKHNKTWCSYMREDIVALMACDYLYTLRNWRHSPGAVIEVQTATLIGINVIHQPERQVQPVGSGEADNKCYPNQDNKQ